MKQFLPNRYILNWKGYLMEQNIYNNDFLFIIDPFADAAKGDDSDVQDGLVHIRIQQRNGRKTLTTIQGLSSDYDLKKIVRACKKVSKFNMYSNIFIRRGLATHWDKFYKKFPTTFHELYWLYVPH